MGHWYLVIIFSIIFLICGFCVIAAKFFPETVNNVLAKIYLFLGGVGIIIASICLMIRGDGGTVLSVFCGIMGILMGGFLIYAAFYADR